MPEKPKKKINIKNKTDLIDTVINVMPKGNKGKGRTKYLARKIGSIIISISVICLIFFVFFVYSNLFRSKAIKKQQESNLIEEIDDLQLEVPKKVIKKVEKEPEILPPTVDKIEEEPINEQLEEANLQGTSTLSTTSIELINELEPEDSNIKEEIISTSTNNTEKTQETISTSTKETDEDTVKNNDNDGDGLSNKEEQDLGSDKDAVDSDNDEFNDLQEVLTLNNPIGEGTLDKNPNITTYTNDELGYSLPYPTAWSYDNLSGNGSVRFQTTDNQIIQIIVPTNTSNLNIEEWYTTEVSARRIKLEQKVKKNDWEGIKSIDGKNIYISHPNLSDRIFVIFYTPGPDEILDYKNIFEMMINGFKVKSNEIITEDTESSGSTTTEEEIIPEDEIEN